MFGEGSRNSRQCLFASHNRVMSGENPADEARRYEDLTARVTANEAKIAALQSDAEEAASRADKAEARAIADGDRIETLEGRAEVDAVVIAELKEQGLVNGEKVANLTAALETARTIGAAIGIVMMDHSVSEPEAFQILRRASMDSNRKLRDLAGDVVLTGQLPVAG